MHEQDFCMLRADIVKEFAREHLGFPEDFTILNNWFMLSGPCKFYINSSKAILLNSRAKCLK